MQCCTNFIINVSEKIGNTMRRERWRKKKDEKEVEADDEKGGEDEKMTITRE